MLSQPGLPIILAAFISSILSGTLLIVNNIINNKVQLEREKEQSIRQQESDQKKWYREKIYNSYETLFQILVKIQQEELEYLHKNRVKTVEDYLNKPKHLNNLNKLISEFNIQFSIIINNYPDKNSKEFTEKLDKINKSLVLHEESWNVRHIILEIMKNDSRIKDTN